MSSTNRGGQRSAADFYRTPAWMVDRLLETCVLSSGGAWLEPSAGDGAIIKAVNARWKDITWTAVELRSECRDALSDALAPTPSPRLCCGDFLQWAQREARPVFNFDVVIGNPPYALAQEFIEASLRLAPVVVFPLRLNFLGGEQRAAWFGRIGMPDVYVLPNRPDYSGGGGDSCEYAWMRFGHVDGPGSIRILATTPKAIRVALKP